MLRICNRKGACRWKDYGSGLALFWWLVVSFCRRGDHSALRAGQPQGPSEWNARSSGYGVGCEPAVDHPAAWSLLSGGFKFASRSALATHSVHEYG